MTCLCFPSFVLNSHGRTDLLQLLHWSFFPCHTVNNSQPTVFFLTHLECAAAICTCHPNGVFAHYTVIKRSAKKSSLCVSAAFYPLECCGPSQLSIYSNQGIFPLSQQTSTGNEHLQIRTRTPSNFTLFSCYRLCPRSEYNQEFQKAAFNVEAGFHILDSAP